MVVVVVVVVEMASKDEGAPALPAVSSAEGSAAAENHPAESGQAQSNPVVEVEPLAQVTSWKDFDPQVEFDKAYRLVRPPVGAIVADPKMSVIYNHTEKELEKLVVCRKEHPSGLYEYHISGIFPVRVCVQGETLECTFFCQVALPKHAFVPLDLRCLQRQCSKHSRTLRIAKLGTST